MINDVYSALVALCCISCASLLIFTTLFGAYICLKIYALYHKLFDKKDSCKCYDHGRKNYPH